eukprot:2680849-Rhodomonas_salina.1
MDAGVSGDSQGRRTLPDSSLSGSDSSPSDPSPSAPSPLTLYLSSPRGSSLSGPSHLALQCLTLQFLARGQACGGNLDREHQSADADTLDQGAVSGRGAKRVEEEEGEGATRGERARRRERERERETEGERGGEREEEGAVA